MMGTEITTYTSREAAIAAAKTAIRHRPLLPISGYSMPGRVREYEVVLFQQRDWTLFDSVMVYEIWEDPQGYRIGAYPITLGHCRAERQAS